MVKRWIAAFIFIAFSSGVPLRFLFISSNFGLTIGSNSILTINPGVMLKFRSCGINVNKGLLAVSNTAGADSQIVFTSYRDDFYGGDTNHD